MSTIEVGGQARMRVDSGVIRAGEVVNVTTFFEDYPEGRMFWVQRPGTNISRIVVESDLESM